MQITLGTQYNMGILYRNTNPLPPRQTKYSGYTISELVHVQKMHNIFRIFIGVPDYSSRSFIFNEEEAIPPPPTNKILRVYYIGTPIQQVK